MDSAALKTADHIQGETRLAERQLEKVQADIDRMNMAKVSEFREYQSQLHVVKNAVQILTEQRQLLETEVSRLTSDSIRVTFELEEYGQKEIKRIESTVQSILSDAQHKLLLAEEIEKEAIQKGETVAKQEKALEARETIFESKEQGIKGLLEHMRGERQEWARRKTVESDEVARLQGLREELSLEVARLKVQVQETQKLVKAQREYALQTQQTADATLNEAQLLVTVNQANEKILAEKAASLDVKEQQLEDRERTLERAYERIRASKS